MSLPERVYRYTDRPMSWTTVVILGFVIWVVAILVLGQIPSVIIYKFDQYIAEIIEFTKKIPWLFFAFLAAWVVIGLTCSRLGRGKGS